MTGPKTTNPISSTRTGLSRRFLDGAALILSVVLTGVGLLLGTFLLGASITDLSLRLGGLVLLILLGAWVGFVALRSDRLLLAPPAYLLAGVACLPFGGGSSISRFRRQPSRFPS